MVAEPSTSPRRLTVAELDRLANCSTCPLGGLNHMPAKAVPGKGRPNARLVIVGEAPVAMEVAKGAPFMGRSGSLLGSTLKRCGLDVQDTYRTNALLCLPPKGPGTKALKACSERLAGELDACSAKLAILCVGTSAANAVLGSPHPVTKHNGRIVWSERYGCWVIIAYHPAAVLRAPALNDDFAWAVRRAVRMAKGELPPEVPVVEPTILRTAEDCKELWNIPAGVVVCDLETTGLDPFLDSVLDIGLHWGSSPYYVIPDGVWQEQAVRDILMDVFGRKDLFWVGHNYKFDVKFLRRAGFTSARIDADTLLMHYALDERSGGSRDGNGGFHGLKLLARRYEDAPEWEDEIDALMKSNGNHMALIPPAIRHKYHAYDLHYTWKLFWRFRGLLIDEQQKLPSRHGWMTPCDTHDRIMVPLVNALADMELRGIRIDLPRLRELQVEYTRLIDEAYATVRQLSGNPELNPRSTQQVQKVLSEMGYPIYGSSDEETIHGLQAYDRERGATPHPFLEAILNARSLAHTKSTYLDGLAVRVRSDGRVHTTLLAHGTSSGRLASCDPNLQNLPKESIIKTLFIPRPGKVLVEADYKQLEVRVLAWYSRDENLLETCNSQDIHWSVAQATFPRIVAAMEHKDLRTMEWLCEQYSLFDDFHQQQLRPSERTDDPEELYRKMKTRLRRQSKHISFGVMYGEGAAALSSPERGMGVSVEEAEQFLEDWRKSYPKAADWLAQQTKFAHEYGWVESYSGHRRRFPGRNIGMVEGLSTESRNHPIQSLAGTITNIAMTRLNRELPERELGDVLMNIHDAILSEVAEDRVEEGCGIIRDTMRGVLTSDDVTFDVDVAIGRNWGEVH